MPFSILVQELSRDKGHGWMLNILLTPGLNTDILGDGALRQFIGLLCYCVVISWHDLPYFNVCICPCQN